jgi:hypothetical protein
LHLGGLTGKRRTAAVVGSDVDDGGATVIFRGGEVNDGVRLLAAVTMACSTSSPSSRNSSHGRMETKISGDTPARITGEPVVYREGKRVMATLYCEGKIIG